VRKEIPFVFASLLLVACAQGEDDALPVFDAAATGAPSDAAVKHDGATPKDAAPGSDTGAGDDSSTGGDTSTGDDSSTGDDGGVDAGTDANDSGPLRNDAGTDSGTATKPTQGDVLITEVMFNPSTTEPDTEWFEVYNAASSPRDIGGLVMGDGTRSETIAGSVVIAPGAYVVLANKNIGSAVPAATVAYHYASLILANSSSASNVSLTSGTTTIAQAPYGNFSSSIKASGSSIELQTLTYAGESSTAAWCESTLTWSGSVDKGTPGAATKCQ
jgi:hypothetical protein